MSKKRPLLYMRIADSIIYQISHDVLKIGDKLPSLRQICTDYGVSMNTAQQGYFELEKKGFIESRPQSGYYVIYSHKRFPSVPSTSNPVNIGATEDSENLIARMFKDLNASDKTLFSLGVPASELLPIPKLNKSLLSAMRNLRGNGTAYEPVQGNEKLRRQIARWSYTWEGQLSEQDLITTAGCKNAIAFSLMALTQRGDTIAVESPVYFGILQLAHSLGLRVLELPTNPITGIELDALKNAFEKKSIKVCLLVSNFSNPLGSCMPEENKREVVRLLEKYNVPLIEDDLYGDLYFGSKRPHNCKTYDEAGMVLWCSSVSKTLAPGYRTGWVAPGKFKEQVMKLKLYHSIAATSVTHEAIADFLENGRYENHLRKFRNVLHANALQYIQAISKYFPSDTRVTRPQGGFMLWLELNDKIDTASLYERAMAYKISIAPGRIFSLQNQFNNCLRLSYGLRWDEKVENALMQLGRLAKD